MTIVKYHYISVDVKKTITKCLEEHSDYRLKIIKIISRQSGDRHISLKVLTIYLHNLLSVCYNKCLTQNPLSSKECLT